MNEEDDEEEGDARLEWDASDRPVSTDYAPNLFELSTDILRTRLQ